MRAQHMIDMLYRSSVNTLPDDLFQKMLSCKEYIKWSELSNEQKTEFETRLPTMFPLYFPEYANKPGQINLFNFKYECFRKHVSETTTDILQQRIPKALSKLCFEQPNRYIAGGFVLNVIHNMHGPIRHNHDIDIYMSLKSAKNFLHELFRLQQHNAGRLQVSCDIKFIYSGLAENNQNILFHIWITVLIGSPRPRYKVFIDLVIVNGDESTIKNTIENTINNFDLTFCKVGIHWQDNRWNTFLPKDVFEDVKSKKGTLCGNFVNEFAKGNKVTHNRIQKYLKKGYTINVPAMSFTNSLNYETIFENRKSISYGERLLRRVTCTFVHDLRDVVWFCHTFKPTYQFVERLRTRLINQPIPDHDERNILNLITPENFENSTMDIPQHTSWEELAQSDAFLREVQPITQQTLHAYAIVTKAIFPNKWDLISKNDAQFAQLMS